MRRRDACDSTNQRLSELEKFKRQADQDRLPGLMDESLWRFMNAEWNAEELRLQTVLQSTSDGILYSQIDYVRRTFEPAQIAQYKWVMQSNSEKAKLARIVRLNCSTDGVTPSFKYRKPLDLIVERGKNEEWRREWDSNPRYSLKYTRFPSVRLKPLGHLSAAIRRFM